MDTLELLVHNDEIHCTYLNVAKAKEFRGSRLHYDKVIDTLIIRFALTDGDEFIHYLDKNLSVIIRESDYEVVGLMVEHFAKEFIKNNPSPKMQPRSIMTDQSFRRVNDAVEHAFEPC